MQCTAVYSTVQRGRNVDFLTQRLMKEAIRSASDAASLCNLLLRVTLCITSRYDLVSRDPSLQIPHIGRILEDRYRYTSRHSIFPLQCVIYMDDQSN